MLVVIVVACGMAADAQAQTSGYAGAVLGTPGLQSYWRLGEASGTTAADATGNAAGSYAGGAALGARGALPLDPDTAVRFDGTDDELLAPGGAAARTIEGWFDWEGGVAVMRDATSAGGWILAYDNAGRVAYRVGGTTFTTTRATADLRTGWHHVALTVSGGGATAFYVDGALVHSGTGAGTAPAALPWHVMRNGTTAQFSRGRADEIAVYDSVLSAATIRDHFERGRDHAGLLRAYSPSLRYEAQEGYFADSAAEMTDNFVAGSRTNYLVNGSGTRLAAADPANPLANLSLGFLGDPAYADGRPSAATDYLDAANSTYQQDAQRMRAAGYGDRVYGRAVTSGGRTFLQYWLFSYYNPQNVLGFGVHEGDWEYVQVALDEDGAPAVASLRAARRRRAVRVGQRAADRGRRARRLRRARLARFVLLRRASTGAGCCPTTTTAAAATACARRWRSSRSRRRSWRGAASGAPRARARPRRAARASGATPAGSRRTPARARSARPRPRPPRPR